MWHEFLQSEGAVLSENNSVRFHAYELGGKAAVHDIVCPLSDHAWIQVAGADAVSFLQGQLTNDLESLTANRWQWAGICNAKGRLLSTLRVLRRGPHVLLELPRERAGTIVAQLRRYLLRAKATVDMLPEDLVAVGTHGRHVGDSLSRLFADLPQRDGDVIENAGTLLYRLPGPQARFVILGSPQLLRQRWRELRASATPSGSSAWRWLDIVSGLPQVFGATAEEFVPQMMNLDLLDGISFKKGCYTGQEIVARMHYLGRLKQRMVLLHSHVEEFAKPGDRVYSAEGGDQAIGTVADGQRAPQGGCDHLAVVQLASLAGTLLRLGAPDGPALERRDLPYPLPLDS